MSAPKAIFIRLSRCDVDIAPYDKCGKIMLYRNVVREQSVGVDAYIDPRLEEINFELVGACIASPPKSAENWSGRPMVAPTNNIEVLE